MPELQEFPLITTSGLTGSVFRRARFLDRTDVNRIRLSDGSEFEVPSNAVRVQPDGSFVYDDSDRLLADLTSPAEKPADPRPNGDAERLLADLSAPEKPAAEKPAARGSNQEFVQGDTLFAEDVTVERVPVNRLIEGPMETRQEGETTVIPVVEEVLIMQKRLFLKEEVRITRRRREVREPRKIMVAGADGHEIAG